MRSLKIYHKIISCIRQTEAQSNQKPTNIAICVKSKVCVCLYDLKKSNSQNPTSLHKIYVKTFLIRRNNVIGGSKKKVTFSCLDRHKYFQARKISVLHLLLHHFKADREKLELLRKMIKMIRVFSNLPYEVEL